MAFAISDLFHNGYRYIYIQSKDDTLNYYNQYGFQIVGNIFEIAGWEGNWYPMVMDISDNKEKFIKDADILTPMVKKFWRYFFNFLKELNNV
ncbi:MAG: hypothetical protein R2568_11030 [Candidatus Scalindua sp.]|jgi:hypothetical protein|nr:hypothetical protein [Candidatus Scalindua sp.]